jgi:hypothetical protein
MRLLKIQGQLTFFLLKERLWDIALDCEWKGGLEQFSDPLGSGTMRNGGISGVKVRKTVYRRMKVRMVKNLVSRGRTCPGTHIPKARNRLWKVSKGPSVEIRVLISDRHSGDS